MKGWEEGSERKVSNQQEDDGLIRFHRPAGTKCQHCKSRTNQERHTSRLEVPSVKPGMGMGTLGNLSADTHVVSV